MRRCINRRKPVPERTDRGGTLRYAWLRAPPLRQMQKTKPNPRSECLTQKPSYEGGQSAACPPSQAECDGWWARRFATESAREEARMFCEELVADEAFVPPERDLIAA